MTNRDAMVWKKTPLIMEGRFNLNTDKHESDVLMLLEAARLETILAETAGTDPNGPQREDHLRSAKSCRALARKPRDNSQTYQEKPNDTSSEGVRER